MERLLSLASPRRLATAAIAAALASAALPRAYSAARSAYLRLRYPAVAGPRGDAEILGELERREARHVKARYDAVAARLAAATAQGFDVSALRTRAQAALSLNTPRFRRQALEGLALVEASIPSRREPLPQATVAPADDGAPPTARPGPGINARPGGAKTSPPPHKRRTQ